MHNLGLVEHVLIVLDQRIDLRRLPDGDPLGLGEQPQEVDLVELIYRRGLGRRGREGEEALPRIAELVRCVRDSRRQVGKAGVRQAHQFGRQRGRVAHEGRGEGLALVEHQATVNVPEEVKVWIV